MLRVLLLLHSSFVALREKYLSSALQGQEEEAGRQLQVGGLCGGDRVGPGHCGSGLTLP